MRAKLLTSMWHRCVSAVHKLKIELRAAESKATELEATVVELRAKLRVSRVSHGPSGAPTIISSVSSSSNEEDTLKEISPSRLNAHPGVPFGMVLPRRARTTP